MAKLETFSLLPLETKTQLWNSGIGGQRGYVSFGKEHAKGRKEAIKEFWHFGQYLDKESKRVSEYPLNVTVDELPRFNIVGKKPYQMLEKRYVMFWGPALPLIWRVLFWNYAKEGNSILRPSIIRHSLRKPENAIRAEAHGDINLITLFDGCPRKSLQVQITMANGLMPLPSRTN